MSFHMNPDLPLVDWWKMNSIHVNQLLIYLKFIKLIHKDTEYMSFYSFFVTTKIFRPGPRGVGRRRYCIAIHFRQTFGLRKNHPVKMKKRALNESYWKRIKKDPCIWNIMFYCNVGKSFAWEVWCMSYTIETVNY